MLGSTPPFSVGEGQFPGSMAKCSLPCELDYQPGWVLGFHSPYPQQLPWHQPAHPSVPEKVGFDLGWKDHGHPPSRRQVSLGELQDLPVGQACVARGAAPAVRSLEGIVEKGWIGDDEVIFTTVPAEEVAAMGRQVLSPGGTGEVEGGFKGRRTVYIEPLDREFRRQG